MINFDDPRFQRLIQENIKAQNFKTHRVLQIIWLTTPISMSDLRLNRNQRFDNRLFNIIHDFFRVVALLLDVLHRKGETPFVADIIFHRCLVLFVIFVRFVYGVVRQMHVQITQVSMSRRLVFNR